MQKDKKGNMTAIKQSSLHSWNQQNSVYMIHNLQRQEEKNEKTKFTFWFEGDSSESNQDLQ